MIQPWRSMNSSRLHPVSARLTNPLSDLSRPPLVNVGWLVSLLLPADVAK